MALTEKEIAQFARFAVEQGAVTAYDATPTRKAKLAKEARLAALSYYAEAQEDIRGSGYRVTQRVKDILWKTLKEIHDRELAQTTVPRECLSTIAMVTGGENVHQVVVVDGCRKRWVGFGWVTEDVATDDDLKLYPLAV